MRADSCAPEAAHDRCPRSDRPFLNSAVADFPIIGDQIRRNVGRVPGNGLGLAIGIAGTFYGGLGIANARRMR